MSCGQLSAGWGVPGGLPCREAGPVQSELLVLFTHVARDMGNTTITITFQCPRKVWKCSRGREVVLALHPRTSPPLLQQLEDR